MNLGLTIFEDGENPDGGMIEEPMTNHQRHPERFPGQDQQHPAHTWTPLAETMADVWYYYKGGNSDNYWPNTGDKAVPDDCPIKYTCQKNYVILMTDGESTQDKWDNAEVR